MNFSHFMPVRVIFGNDVVSRFDFSRIGRRALLITGRTGAKKSGALGDVTDNLAAAGIEWSVFDSIEENPSVESCASAGEAARDFGADMLIAIGGGSAMDAAKSAAVFATNEFESPYEIYAAIPKKPLPLIVVGTTSGTGSEVTAVSVMTAANDRGEHFKKSLKSPRLYPLCALTDPKYTEKLPWNITLATALDVVSHSIESLFSPRADEMSLLFAKEALSASWNAVKTAHWQSFVEFREIAPDVRETLSKASILAGMAINSTGTGFAHAMSYPFSVEKMVPHGLACAFFLIPYTSMMKGADKHRDSLFLEAVGYSFEEFAEDMAKLLPAPPVLSYDDVDRFSALTSPSASLANSVVPLTASGVEKLYDGFRSK